METKIYKSSKYQIVKSDIDGKMKLTILATNANYSVIEKGGEYQVRLGDFNSKDFEKKMELFHKIELNDESIDNALSLISNK